MYFADKPIPANESNADAFILCSSVEGAKKYCPNRWKAMQNWFAEARKVNNEVVIYVTTPLLPSFFFLHLSSPLRFSAPSQLSFEINIIHVLLFMASLCFLTKNCGHEHSVLRFAHLETFNLNFSSSLFCNLFVLSIPNHPCSFKFY